MDTSPYENALQELMARLAKVERTVENIQSSLTNPGQHRDLFNEKDSLLSLDENKTVVRRYFDDLVNQANLSLVTEIVAPEFVSDVRRLIMMVHTAFPDFHITIEEMIAEKDKVAAIFNAHGTHQKPAVFTVDHEGREIFIADGKPFTRPTHGRQYTIPPTGQHFSQTGVIVFQIARGKIANNYGGWVPQRFSGPKFWQKHFFGLEL